LRLSLESFWVLEQIFENETFHPLYVHQNI
jgi:hypothetical protein